MLYDTRLRSAFPHSLKIIMDTAQSTRDTADAERGHGAGSFGASVFDRLATHIAIVDAQGVILEVNRAWREFAAQNGAPTGTAYVGTNYFNVCAASSDPTVEESLPLMQGMRQVLAGEVASFELEYPCHSPTQLRWFAARVTRFLDGGRALLLVTHDEITAYKEEALRESEERLRTVIDATPDIICFKDAEGRWLLANKSILDLYAIKGVEYQGRAEVELADFTAPIFRTAFRQCNESDKAAWAASGLSRTEEVIPSADGALNTFDILKIPLFHPDGQRRGLIVIGRNITERVRADERLRLQSAMLQAAANSILIADRAGQLLWVNTAFTQLTGYSAEEAVGQNTRLLKSGKQDAAFYARLWQTILAGEAWQGELVNKRKDGTLYSESMTITPVRDASGLVHRFIAIKQDVTARHELEESLRQSQKMESIGRLAGGIAHDFNNILQTIIGFNELLLAATPATDARSSDLDEIGKAAQRAAELTHQLLAFSRRQTLMLRVLDLNYSLTESEKMLRRLLGEDIQLTLQTADDLHRTQADPGQISQIIMNLAINARDAMPKGGRMTMSTSNIAFDKQATAAVPGAVPGDYVCFAVSDTGCGMSAAVQQHIFEPFFTTKAPGQGTGLGLAVIYGIVKQSNGWLHVYSQEGLGTTFKIYLPAFAGTAQADGARTRSDAATLVCGRGERILLVEDEPGVRLLATRVCAGAGYTVIACASAQEAEQVWLREAGHFDLLFSDVVLADRSGIELATRILAQRPGLPVLLCSGYSDESSRWADIAANHFHYLQKPYPVATLLDALRQTLAGTSTTA